MATRCAHDAHQLRSYSSSKKADEEDENGWHMHGYNSMLSTPLLLILSGTSSDILTTIVLSRCSSVESPSASATCGCGWGGSSAAAGGQGACAILAPGGRCMNWVGQAELRHTGRKEGVLAPSAAPPGSCSSWPCAPCDRFRPLDSQQAWVDVPASLRPSAPALSADAGEVTGCLETCARAV